MNTRKLKYKNLSKKYKRALLTLGLTFLGKTQNPEAVREDMDRFDTIKIKISVWQEATEKEKIFSEYLSEKG